MYILHFSLVISGLLATSYQQQYITISSKTADKLSLFHHHFLSLTCNTSLISAVSQPFHLHLYLSREEVTSVALHRAGRRRVLLSDCLVWL